MLIVQRNCWLDDGTGEKVRASPELLQFTLRGDVNVCISFCSNHLGNFWGDFLPSLDIGSSRCSSTSQLMSSYRMAMIRE